MQKQVFSLAPFSFLLAIIKSKVYHPSIIRIKQTASVLHILNLANAFTTMIPPQVVRRLTREVIKLQKSPPDGIAIELAEQDILNIDGWIQGPTGTPYENGYFRVNFQFLGTDFPIGPPKCTMVTKIFHPNIHANGEICVSTLKKDWNSTFGIEHILTVIKCLLISPNPDSALDAEAAQMLQQAYDEYASTASMWTRIHASNRPACMPENTIQQRSNRTFSEASTSTITTKKMDVERSHGFSNSNTENAFSIASQPLARSGSTNMNLHQKSSFDSQRRQIPTNSSNGGVGLSTLQHNQQDEIAFSNSMNATTTMIVQSGAAAVAAAATVAAMTAAMTAGMCKVSLQDSSISNFVENESVKIAQTRRRVPVIRRGIKRL